MSIAVAQHSIAVAFLITDILQTFRERLRRFLLLLGRGCYTGDRVD